MNPPISDEAFEQLFESCSMPAEDFTHEAHLRLAWIHISKYGIDTAVENIKTQLKAYTASLGAADKYNETLTIAAIHAVHHFRKKSSSDGFDAFIKEFPALKNNLKGLLEQHYGFSIFSEEAKMKFLLPDLLPFD